MFFLALKTQPDIQSVVESFVGVGLFGFFSPFMEFFPFVPRGMLLMLRGIQPFSNWGNGYCAWDNLRSAGA